MTTRRHFLRTAGAVTAGGLMGLGGCANQERVRKTVSLMAAGSLNNAFENGLRKAVAPRSIDLEIEAHGSAIVARMIAEGQRDPDIVSLADAALFDGPLHPLWYAEFATNALVLVYNADTRGGKRVVADAGRWYEPIRSGAARLGRTDPETDPLGYRALFMLELASRYYDGAGKLRKEIPSRDQIFPETGLISQFETGAIDAAIAYRSMAVERGYDYLDLPEQIDLSAPRFADDWYATTDYALPGGKTVTGGLISYGTTVRGLSAASARVFKRQLTGDYLKRFGFGVPEHYPQYHGDPPREIQV